jgi:hypothetical protein
MKIFSIVPALLLAGCATTGGTHDSVAVVGKVLETFEVSAEGPSSAGAYRPGMGGAVGGAVAGLLMWSGKDPAHTIYVVKLPDDSKRYVRQQGKVNIGDCVAVLTEKPKIGQESWLYGEASLKQSKDCV